MLYLVGCGSGGGGESPVEIRVSNNGDFQIRSKADSVTIQGVKLNRDNCVVNFVSKRDGSGCFKPNGCFIKSNYSNFYARF
ncbi:hypothetical protein KKKH29_14140 [Helicobacter pylori]